MLANEIRPFVRTARKAVPDLGTAAARLSAATPPLTTVASKVNRLANMAAFNPNGAEPAGTANRDEGYLYWAAWLGHDGSNVFSTGDAHGFTRAIYASAGCPQLAELISESPLAPVITGYGPLFAAGGPCNP